MNDHEGSLRAAVLTALENMVARGHTPCAGQCGRPAQSWRAYRCYYCGLWFCEFCAPQHFGASRVRIVPEHLEDRWAARREVEP